MAVLLVAAGQRGLTGQQTTEILRMAATPPQQRLDNTLALFHNRARLAQDPTAVGFGLAVDPKAQMLKLTARVLPPPMLVCDGSLERRVFCAVRT
jgi:hypothetical protein